MRFFCHRAFTPASSFLIQSICSSLETCCASYPRISSFSWAMRSLSCAFCPPVPRDGSRTICALHSPHAPHRDRQSARGARAERELGRPPPARLPLVLAAQQARLGFSSQSAGSLLSAFRRDEPRYLLP